MGLAATMWDPMGAEVPVLPLNYHPNTSQGQQKGFRKCGIFENFQVSLNSLHNRNFGHSSLNVHWHYVQKSGNGEVGRFQFRRPWPPLQVPRLCPHGGQEGRAGRD